MMAVVSRKEPVRVVITASLLIIVLRILLSEPGWSPGSAPAGTGAENADQPSAPQRLHMHDLTKEDRQLIHAKTHQYSAGHHYPDPEKLAKKVEEAELMHDPDEEEEPDERDLEVKNWRDLLRKPQDLVISRSRIVNGTEGSGRDGSGGRFLVFNIPDPRNKGNDRTVHIEHEFSPVIPAKDVYGMKYDTCAVVGNSGILKHSGHGAEIDSHDAIIRINYAPINGYEQDVGSKVTFDLVNKENAGKLAKNQHRWRHPNLNSTLLCFETHSRVIRTKVYLKVLDRMRQLKSEYRAQQNAQCNPPPEEGMGRVFCDSVQSQPRMWLLAPTLVTASRAVWISIKHRLESEIQTLRDEKLALQSGANPEAVPAAKFHYHDKPMSGMVAMYFALQVCKKITLYGFEPYKENTRTSYHYFDRREGMTKVHSFDLAIEAFKIIGKYHPVTVVT